MKKYKRIFTIVIDSLGAGALPDAAEYGVGRGYTGTYFREHGRISYTESAEAGNRQSSSAETGGADGETAWLLRESARGEYRKRYDDRTLGDDGASYHKAVQDIFRARISAGTDRGIVKENRTCDHRK